MSGDVQPRKRKDKKRKKEEITEQLPPQFQTPSAPSASDDINIHVHKDEGTGGGICAKIVFFFLFSALAVLIGLIITEHRGLTDLDTVDSESRFSQIFEGWIDNSVGHDDHDDHLEDHLEDSLEHDQDDHDEHGDESHEGDDEHDHEEEEEEEEEEVSDEKSQTAEDEEDATEEDEETAEESTLESEEEEAEQEDEDEDESATQYDEDEEEEQEQEPSDEQEQSEEQPEPSEEQEASEEQEVSEEQEASEEAAEDDAVSKEPAESEEEQETADDDDDDKPEESTEQDDDQVREDGDATADNEENTDNSRMAVKIGVGVALLVVAHVVLVRKWKTASTQETPTETQQPIPDLARRNTIVVPPSFQEVQHDIDDAGDEVYSDEEDEDEEVEEIESEDDRPVQKSIKTKYQELRSTYSRSLTPDTETERREKSTATTTAAEEYEEYDEGGEDVEEEEEEDIEDEEDEVDEGEEEEDEEDDEEEDFEKDQELLKRLEAKYGVNVRPDNEPEESDSDRQSDDVDAYEYENITNKDDWKIKEKLDEAQKASQNNAAYAIKLFDVLLKNYPSSPRSLYGKAQALDSLADQKRSNDILQQAIATYLQVLKLEHVPDALFRAAADRCINRMRFIGRHDQAIDVHNLLINRFPHDPKHLNQLAVTCLTINRVNKARAVLIETLKKHPENGLALVHYGFILKTTDNNLNESVVYLKKGIETKEPGVIDGRFYFHLGDALSRLGRNEEALKVYEEAVDHKLFLSKYQRSLYNAPHLKPQPWWSKEETPYGNLYSALEQNWKQIRDEGLAVLSGAGRFENESENLRDTGDWKQFELFARGQKNAANCKKCPVTCKIIDSAPDARGCKRGQTKFSVMHPGTHVWPHCGPTNCRLRVHLGLQVPPDTFIRVTDGIRSWENGKILIFDDSFEHEVWHNGTAFRLILIVDVWHPELTANQKRSLPPI